MPTKSRRKKSRAVAVAAKNISVAAEAYVPTRAEGDALVRFKQRLERTPASAAIKVETDGATFRLPWDHPNQAVGAALWATALGTADLTLAAALFRQLVEISRVGAGLCETELNDLLAMVRGLAPTDATEALLVTQMVAVHKLSMVEARRLALAEGPDQQDRASISLNKLARTFSAQLETLKRYRSKGEQVIRVQHQQVTVNEGGQAIVGDVQHSQGVPIKNGSQSHVLTDALGPALLGPVQTIGQSVPSTSRPGKAGVPLPRRPRRGPKRVR
jgi:hypothetical protein